MIIKKYLHSCLLVEEKKTKLLIDPGAFSFVEKKLKPEDLGSVDAVLLTHKHMDHYFPEALKIILKNKTRLLACEEIATLAKKDGFECEIMKASQILKVGDISIKAFNAPHEPIPTEIPDNLAYLINDKLLHPGDSYHVHGLKSCEILALPVAGPWSRLVDGLTFASSLKPKIVIPIHDAILKDFMLERIYTLTENYCKEKGIQFKLLSLGASLSI